MSELSELDELKMETQAYYDDYLMATEHRGISYGEIAYIQGLDRDGLDDLCAAIDEEMNATIRVPQPA